MDKVVSATHRATVSDLPLFSVQTMPCYDSDPIPFYSLASACQNKSGCVQAQQKIGNIGSPRLPEGIRSGLCIFVSSLRAHSHAQPTSAVRRRWSP